MKKIKGILLFGILTLLGIGSSFASVNTFTAVEYFDNSNKFSNYIFSYNADFKFMSANGGAFSSINSFFRTGNMTIDNNFFSPSNFDLLTGYYYGGNHSFTQLKSYSNGLGVSLLFRSYRYYGTYLLTLSNGVFSTTSEISNNTGMFFRIQDNDGYGVSSDNPFNTSVPVESARTFSFFDNYLYDSNNGVVNDLNFSGVDYKRGSVVGNIFDNYSFSYTPDYIITGSSIVIDKDSVPYFFSTVQPAVSNGWRRINNLYIIKLNSFYKKTNTGDFRILAISLTGSTINEDTKDFIYSRYTCPYNSVSYVDCTYIDGGYLRSSNISNAFSSYNGVLYSLTGDTSSYNYFSNLLFFLTISTSSLSSNGLVYVSPTIYSVESTNIITLYRPTSINNGLNYSFGLSPVEGINVLSGLPNNSGGGGNQSSYSGSVSLDNCIETTVYTYSTGTNGENLRFSHIECLSPEIIESGSYISSNGTIYYVDSSYNVGNISNSDGTIYDSGFLDEDGLLSIDYYSGLFNGNGFRFGVCPYPPSDYLNFATKIKLGNFYPFMPLNCFISAFQQGVKVHYFDDSGLFPDNHSQLMAGDSHYHKTLFRFFDVLLSIGLLLLLSALLRIIKK